MTSETRRVRPVGPHGKGRQDRGKQIEGADQSVVIAGQPDDQRSSGRDPS